MEFPVYVYPLSCNWTLMKALTVNWAWTPRRFSCFHDSGNTRGKDFVSPGRIPIIESMNLGITLSPSSVSKWKPAGRTWSWVMKCMYYKWKTDTRVLHLQCILADLYSLQMEALQHSTHLDQLLLLICQEQQHHQSVEGSSFYNSPKSNEYIQKQK